MKVLLMKTLRKRKLFIQYFNSIFSFDFLINTSITILNFSDTDNSDEKSIDYNSKFSILYFI